MKIRVKGDNPVGITIRSRTKEGEDISHTFSVYDTTADELYQYLSKHLHDLKSIPSGNANTDGEGK